jgi:hypothetical protein
MKFRVQGNAIRFRLNQREVEEFRSSGRVSDVVEFPGGRAFTYSLIEGGDALSAAFDQTEIRVTVPKMISEEWAGTDQVGMSAKIEVGDGRELSIVIEKDFQCLHKGDAGKDPDAYPNPMAGLG